MTIKLDGKVYEVYVGRYWVYGDGLAVRLFDREREAIEYADRRKQEGYAAVKLQSGYHLASDTEEKEFLSGILSGDPKCEEE